MGLNVVNEDGFGLLRNAHAQLAFEQLFRTRFRIWQVALDCFGCALDIFPPTSSPTDGSEWYLVYFLHLDDVTRDDPGQCGLGGAK